MRTVALAVAILACTGCDDTAKSASESLNAAPTLPLSPVSAAPQTELSRKLLPLVHGPKRPTRKQVVAALGPPSWVFLKGDKHDLAPEGDAVAALEWDNGDSCTLVAIEVDRNDIVVGSDAGTTCGDGMGSVFAGHLRATKDAYICARKERAKFCLP